MTSELSNRSKLVQIITNELQSSSDQTHDPNNQQEIKLIDLQIQSFPSEIIELIKDSVERLSLQRNHLTSLPSYFNRLTKLRYLDIHDNKFQRFPEILVKMFDLEILDISFNYLSELPANMGNLKKLKVLSIKRNKFESIPYSILQLKDLRIFEIENNPLNQETMHFLSNTSYKPQSLEWLEETKSFVQQYHHHHPYSEPIDYEDESKQIPQTSTASHFTLNSSTPTTMTPSSSNPQLERSRSTSESYVSSRAAKRMGFIIKRNNTTQELANDTIKESSSPATLDPKRNRSFSTSLLNQQKHYEDSEDTPTHSSTTNNNDYFKRLSTLQENDSESLNSSTPIQSAHPDSNHILNDSITSSIHQREPIIPTTKIIDISKKIIFAFTEFQNILKKLNSYCMEKSLIIEIMELVYSTKIYIDQLMEILEDLHDLTDLTKLIVQILSNFQKIINFISVNYQTYLKNIDVCFIRMFYLSLFMVYSEIYNAFRLLSPRAAAPPASIPTTNTTTTSTTVTNTTSQSGSKLPPLRIPDNINTVNAAANATLTQQQLNEYNEVDEKLYESLKTVLQSSSLVYSELNDAISKSALANARDNHEGNTVPASSISKIKELTNTCVTSMDLNRKIKTKMASQSYSIKNFTIHEKKKFYDEINSFLKSIITILGSTKSIMNESTILNEVRPSLASLTKATKDVTIMLEISSYRLINDSYQNLQSSIPSAIPQSAVHPTSSSSSNTLNINNAPPPPPPMLSSIPSVMSIPMNTPSYNFPLTTTSSTHTPMAATPYNNVNPFEQQMVNNMQSNNES